MITHMAQRLLACPKRTVTPTVPHLAQKPAYRVALAAQPPRQAHAVAEAGGIPQAQFVTRVRTQQQVIFGKLGHMRCIAHFTHIALEQRARQSCFASVGVGHQADGYGGRCHHAANACFSAASATAGSHCALSSDKNPTPFESANCFQALRRSTRRDCKAPKR